SHLYTSIYTVLSFFFNHPPTTDIYTLSLHDALPILPSPNGIGHSAVFGPAPAYRDGETILDAYSGGAAVRTIDTTHLDMPYPTRSEEHTSELQSRGHLVCRLLLEKKNKKKAFRA